jgi:hypothetical protein
MRVKWWLGFMTIAVAAPFGAHADNQATKLSDRWDAGVVWRLPEPVRLPEAVESQSDPRAARMREWAAIRAVDTRLRRGFQTASTPREVSTSRVVATATPHATAAPAAAPEMNAGFAAVGLTFLFGTVAILRGRGSRINV